ncbi:GerAB/ArcD/ProY family transporter [Lysinibacillus irui]|uniref:GerAB/ArcD/ProY family transporter n=1 Tax=Lysinibacillus irui TaxID=2998077 RepID=A0AAJ5RW70_9BACI|nr:GerAB/ArcD/ProY family transporter [Lysinibacillus irui]WDV09348.1 GerAB/ArcD/ProY family transporter [Lysinibacillus irui]
MQNETFKPFYLFFITYMTQMGIVFFSLPNIIATHFGYNGWIMIIPISVVVLIHIGLIAKIYSFNKGESIFETIESLNSKAKMILMLLYISLSIFWSILAVTIAKHYAYVMKFLYFPYTDIQWFVLLTLILAFYLVTRGIITIVHITTIFFFLSAPIIFLLFYFVPDFSFLQFSTFLFNENKDFYGGIIELYTAFLGFEVILFMFPYISKEKSGFKYVFWAHLYTSFVYLIVTIFSYGFNSIQQLTRQVYPVVTLMRYIEFEFIERLDSIIFILFYLKVLITITMYVWISLVTLKRVVKWSDNLIVFVLLIVGYLSTLPFVTKKESIILLSALTKVQLFLSVFLPLLLLMIIFKKRRSNG